MITPGTSVSSTSEPGTPDYIVTELLKEIRNRIDYLKDAQAYLEGDPGGIIFEPEEDQKFNGMDELLYMSVTNYADLIVSATTDRLGILGFRTALGSGESGDPEASKIFQRGNMTSKLQEAIEWACGYRSAYLFVDPKSHNQMVFPPSNAAVMNDNQGEPVGAIIMYRNRVLERDILECYIRDVDPETGNGVGRVMKYMASRQLTKDSWNKLKITETDREVPIDPGVGNGWEWWKPVPLHIERIPVTPLRNKSGFNEFEKHTSVINRINHMVYQRVIIATHQALRQRVLIGDFPKTDKAGREINYDDKFSAGPAELWVLPSGAQVWESSASSFQDILTSVKDDEKVLAAVSRTPSSYFSDSVNMAAEGANLAREGYLAKIADRRERFGDRVRRHVSIYFEVVGDKERSEMDSIEVMWKSSRPETLSERAAAFASLRQNGIATKSAMRIALDMSPEEIMIVESENLEERLTKAIEAQISSMTTPLEKTAAMVATGQQQQQASGEDAQSKVAEASGEKKVKTDDSSSSSAS